MSTALTIKFDFTSTDQQAVLSKLQQKGYSLLVLQNATSSSSDPDHPLTAWFTMPFSTISGVLSLPYTPDYKACTQMGDATSDVVPLGTTLTYNVDNNTFANPVSNPDASGAITIAFANYSPPSNFIGLASSINQGSYVPFCFFQAESDGGPLVITPSLTLTVAVGIYSQDTWQDLGAGAMLTFSLDGAPNATFNLAVQDNTYAVVGADYTNVQPVSASDMNNIALWFQNIY